MAPVTGEKHATQRNMTAKPDRRGVRVTSGALALPRCPVVAGLHQGLMTPTNFHCPNQRAFVTDANFDSGQSLLLLGPIASQANVTQAWPKCQSTNATWANFWSGLSLEGNNNFSFYERCFMKKLLISSMSFASLKSAINFFSLRPDNIVQYLDISSAIICLETRVFESVLYSER